METGERGLTLGRIADLLAARLRGEASRAVLRVAPLEEAGPQDLSILAHPKYRRAAGRSAAGALLVKSGLELEGRGAPDQLIVPDPHLALTILLPLLSPAPAPPRGISPDARIARDARVGEGAAVGAFAVLEAGCSIGAGAVVGAGCYVGAGSEIGEGCELHPNTTIYPGCRLGRRVIVHSGSVIGSDGFGYATQAGIHRKIPQIGAVDIGDDVEIGAGVTIDRGSIGTTVIGQGTKIDNLVQIGHNVRIGPHCLLVAQVGISGSTRIGARTTFAGQSGAAGHLSIGSGVIVASKSAVYADLPDGAFVAGIPAVDHRRWKKAQVLTARLPELRAELRDLARRVESLESARGGPSKGARKATQARKRGRVGGAPPRAAAAPPRGAASKERKAPASRRSKRVRSTTVRRDER